MPRTRPARALGLVLLLVAAVAAAGCGASGTGAGTTGAAVTNPAPAQAVKELDGRMVIDVRTPAEYAEGHIAGAINIDVESGDFAGRIAELDKGGEYFVYCRSGRRSAIAAEQMAAAGFTSIVDGGGLADLAAAGAPLE